MKTKLESVKKTLFLISLLGIGALGAACGRSASTGVEADLSPGADPGFVQENPPPAADNPAESPAADLGEEPGETPAPEEPGAGDQSATPTTCYRFAFVSDRAPAENVFLSDSCNPATAVPLTGNTRARTHFGNLSYNSDGGALAFDRATVSIPLGEPVPVLARLDATPVLLETLDSGDLGAFDAGVFAPQRLAFEPGGSRVAFVGVSTHGVGLGADFRVIEVEELRLYDAATGEGRALINTLDDRRKIGRIAWQDAGHLIFSMRLGEGPQQLYRYDLEGHDFQALEQSGSPSYRSFPIEGGAPAVKPGGAQLAFVRKVDGRNQIFACSLVRRGYRALHPNACSGVLQLTSEGDNSDPAWTPDGEYLFFTSDRDGNENIHRMKKDGTEQTALTTAFSDEKRVAVHPQSFTAP